MFEMELSLQDSRAQGFIEMEIRGKDRAQCASFAG